MPDETPSDPAAPPPVVTQLIISLHANGRVSASGEVIQNAVMAYGMLTAAQHAIKEWHAAQNAQRRVELVGAMPGLKVLEK